MTSERAAETTFLGGAAHRWQRGSRLTRPAIEVHDLTVAYRESPSSGTSTSRCPQGVLMAIVGPNGAGKTTLIKAILGLVTPAAGRVLILRRAVRRAAPRGRLRAAARDASTGTSRPSVLDVVTDGPLRARSAGSAGRRDSERDGARSSARAGRDATTSRGRQISQLSGGQQQRVFLARALVQDARALPDGRAVPGRGRDDRAGDRRRSCRSCASGARRSSPCTTTCRPSPEYFDRVVLLNVRLVASGPVAECSPRRTCGAPTAGARSCLSGRGRPRSGRTSRRSRR